MGKSEKGTDYDYNVDENKDDVPLFWEYEDRTNFFFIINRLKSKFPLFTLTATMGGDYKSPRIYSPKASFR